MKKDIYADYSRTTVQLMKPTLHDGKELTEVSFDWGSLTGKDMLEIEQKMNSSNRFMASARFSGEFLCGMAQRASDQHLDKGFFERMSLGDYNNVRNGAKDFLFCTEFLNTASEDGSENGV